MPRVLACLIVLVVALVAAPAAEARVGSCLAPGSKLQCTIWTGKVTYIGDGDTIYVDVKGDRTSKTLHVRMTGFNAMEQSVYSSIASRRRGECHALEATSRLEQLIRASRWRVRLAALDPGSHSGLRPRRAVAVRIDGRWRDVGAIMLAEGHALFLPNRSEWAWNDGYSQIAEQAAATGHGLWNPTYCGLGPSDASPLRVIANADADGAGRGQPQRRVDARPQPGHRQRGPPRRLVAARLRAQPLHVPRAGPRCLRASRSRSTSARAPRPGPSSSGTASGRRSRTRPAASRRWATAPTCSTRRATCAPS